MAYHRRFREDDQDDTASIDTVLPAYSPPASPVPVRPPSPAPSYRTQADPNEALVVRRWQIPPAPVPTFQHRPKPSRTLFAALFNTRESSKGDTIINACSRGTVEDWATVLSILESSDFQDISRIDLQVALMEVVARHDYHDGDLENAGRKRVAKALLDAGAHPNDTSHHNKSLLCEAVTHRRNEEIVDRLLKGGADPNQLSPSSVHPLSAALTALNQSVQNVELLVRAGANVKLCNGNGQFPLHVVANRWRTDEASYLVQLLVAAGADLDVGNEQGDYPLHVAIDTDNHVVREALLDAGARLDGQAMSRAARRDEKVMWSLLNQYPSAINATDAQGRPFLALVFEATYIPHLTAEQLVDRMPDLRRRMPDGSTILHAAVKARRWESVIKLVGLYINHKIETDAKDADGMTALHLAASSDNPAKYAWHWQDAVKLLARNASNIDARTRTSATALHLAANSSCGAYVLRSLISAGASLNISTAGGDTPLHLAKCCESKRLLLEAGASQHIRNSRGRLPGMCRTNVCDSSKSVVERCQPHPHCLDCVSNAEPSDKS